MTLAQPVVTTVLYFLVFGYAVGTRVRERVREIDGVPYVLHSSGLDSSFPAVTGALFMVALDISTWMLATGYKLRS